MNTVFRGFAGVALPRSAAQAALQTEATAAAPRRIRVLLVVSNLEYGGAQRQIVELANNVAPDRVEVHVCSLSPYVPLASELQIRPARMHIIHKRAKFDLTVVPRLARLLREHRFDVAHGYLFDAEIAVRLAGRMAGTPLVVGSERNTDYSLKRIQRVVYRLTRGQVDAVIANSTAGAAFNRQLLGHPAGIYRVVHNGVDVRRFRPRDAVEARHSFGIPLNAPVVGMFASFKEQKNHPLLFAAAARLVARVPEARLVFVGDELHSGMHGSREYRAKMDQLVDDLGLRQHCIFLGNRDSVEQIYPACDVTVLPSLFEGTPNVVLESLACGVPVVATDVSDNALIVPDGEVGFIVALGDESALADRLERLLTDVTLKARMSVAARDWVEREYSTARLATNTETAYRECLARSRRWRQ